MGRCFLKVIALQANCISKSFGEQQVLDGISFTIAEKERVGVVGPNGSGKSTLIKCVTTEIAPDLGTITVAKGLTLGYLEQLCEHESQPTAWEVVMSAYANLLEQRQLLRTLEKEMAQGGDDLNRTMARYAAITESYERSNGYACETMVRRILLGLGFEPRHFEQTWQSFSGGEKTRLNLARLLALQPDILLLDEPTNHLDTESVEWLENFLSDYSGTILVVSHDRRFLDRIATRIVELRHCSLKSYSGNYSQYMRLKAENDLVLKRAYDKQQEFILKTEAYIERFRAGIKSRQARGRQSILDRLEKIEGPIHDHNIKMSGFKVNTASGNDVWMARGINKSWDNHLIFEDVDLNIRKHDRLALVGPNGSGKTTLIKIIMGQVAVDGGDVRTGNKVEIGYFSQDNEELDVNRSVLDEIVHNCDITIAQARDRLAQMMFKGDDVFKLIGSLSGGERVRVSLLKLMLSGANFLILDEPTNHLDIDSMQAVEIMLQEFDGTLLLVSHDRYFIDQLVGGILAIENHTLKLYLGSYHEYKQKIAAQKSRLENAKKESKPERPKRSPQEEEQKEKLKLKKKLTAAINELESRIEVMENRKIELETLLSDPATYLDENEARSCTASYHQLDQTLQEAYQQWEILWSDLEESNDQIITR